MEDFSTLIIEWYKKNQRELPWREYKKPVHIFVAEFLLQFGTTDKVVTYYKRVFHRYTTFRSLSNASIDLMTKMLSGLCTEQNVLKLIDASLDIMEKHDGVLPNNYDNIRALPGVLPNTAAIISATCFSLPHVIFDRHIIRIYSRVFDDHGLMDLDKEKKRIRRHLEEMIPENSGDFNQGLRELGETICVAKGVPNCEVCPLRKICLSRQRGTNLNLPQKSNRASLKKEELSVIAYYCGSKILIERRVAPGILQGLWQFPTFDFDLSRKDFITHCLNCKMYPSRISTRNRYKYSFGHKRWIVRPFYVEMSVHDKDLLPGIWVTKEELKSKYSLSDAFDPMLEDLDEFMKEVWF